MLAVPVQGGLHGDLRARSALGASEHGLLFTTAEDIALADIDGNLHPGEPPISLPAELPIHSALLAARPVTKPRLWPPPHIPRPTSP